MMVFFSKLLLKALTETFVLKIWNLRGVKGLNHNKEKGIIHYHEYLHMQECFLQNKFMLLPTVLFS